MYHHIWAEIDLDALSYNIKQLLTFLPAEQLMGVVKANAYGHGAGAITKVLASHGVTSFAVSNPYEAIDLRKSGVQGEILLLGYADPTAVGELITRDITVCLFDLASAHCIDKAAAAVGGKIKAHLKLDTGMCRLGFPCRDKFSPETFAEDMETVLTLPHLSITGAFTHFASADRATEGDDVFTGAQYERFQTACRILAQTAAKHGLPPLCFHSHNSAASLLDYADRPSEKYRVGVALYGLSPTDGIPLPFTPKPVMTLKATIAQVKEIAAGDTVSYGRTFRATQPMKIAVVTAGYADGYMRGLSNKGWMMICGQKAPILGRVCMDQTVVDVTDVANVKTGDTAILFGEGLPVDRLAEWLETIHYELVCAVARRVPRVYLQQGKIVDTVRYLSI